MPCSSHVRVDPMVQASDEFSMSSRAILLDMPVHYLIRNLHQNVLQYLSSFIKKVLLWKKKKKVKLNSVLSHAVNFHFWYKLFMSWKVSNSLFISCLWHTDVFIAIYINEPYCRCILFRERKGDITNIGS